VAKADLNVAMDVLEKSGAQPEQIGKVVDKPQITVQYGGKTLMLA
jgi:hypothetical protein